MQLVVNCVIHDREQARVLMLQKPRRGWWVAPGGKVETGESLAEAVVREVWEETGLTVQRPELRGVFTIHVQEQGELVNHWMLFTYYAHAFDGTVLTETEEGRLEWVPEPELLTRPMAEGDRRFLQPIVERGEFVTGKFVYTPDYELLSWHPE